MTTLENDRLVEAVNSVEERCIRYPGSYSEQDKALALLTLVQAAKALPLHSEYTREIERLTED